MPKVTDKQYQLPDFLIEKMDCAHTRITKRKLDCIFMIDGDEGFGKTGISIELAYYLAWKSGREFSLKNIFFDPKELIQFINSTTKQVIIWDEAALGGLASGWQSKIQQMMIQTLMTCRSRQHVIFFNCPKFYRLNKYFVMDRADGLVHVYSENKIDAGLCTFYKKEWLENMIEFYNRKNRKPYKLFYKKRLRGNFVDAFELDIINEKEYDKKKEFYTEKILAQYGNDRNNDKLLRLQYKISQIKDMQKQELAKALGVARETISDWVKIPIKYPEIFKEVN